MKWYKRLWNWMNKKPTSGDYLIKKADLKNGHMILAVPCIAVAYIFMEKIMSSWIGLTGMIWVMFAVGWVTGIMAEKFYQKIRKW